jgi:hypothetical protein
MSFYLSPNVEHDHAQSPVRHVYACDIVPQPHCNCVNRLYTVHPIKVDTSLGGLYLGNMRRGLPIAFQNVLPTITAMWTCSTRVAATRFIHCSLLSPLTRDRVGVLATLNIPDCRMYSSSPGDCSMMSVIWNKHIIINTIAYMYIWSRIG